MVVRKESKDAKLKIEIGEKEGTCSVSVSRPLVVPRYSSVLYYYRTNFVGKVEFSATNARRYNTKLGLKEIHILVIGPSCNPLIKYKRN